MVFVDENKKGDERISWTPSGCWTGGQRSRTKFLRQTNSFVLSSVVSVYRTLYGQILLTKSKTYYGYIKNEHFICSRKRL